MAALKQGLENMPKPQPREENDSFKKTVSMLEQSKQKESDMEERIAQLEDSLAASVPSC